MFHCSVTYFYCYYFVTRQWIRWSPLIQSFSGSPLISISLLLRNRKMTPLVSSFSTLSHNSPLFFSDVGGKEVRSLDSECSGLCAELLCFHVWLPKHWLIRMWYPEQFLTFTWALKLFPFCTAIGSLLHFWVSGSTV